MSKRTPEITVGPGNLKVSRGNYLLKRYAIIGLTIFVLATNTYFSLWG